ncbi:MAG: hypothetical protein V8S98_03895 [Lachnospiraceae bacterium]
MKRKKNNSPYLIHIHMEENTSFDQHISELDDLSGFRTAQDYANEHTPGIGNRNRQVYERIPSAGRTISPGMMKIAAVGAVIAIPGVIGACGGFQRLTKRNQQCSFSDYSSLSYDPALLGSSLFDWK